MFSHNKDLVKCVPKRVLIIALIATVILPLLSLVFQWPLIPMLIGLWSGTLVNLINFRLLIMNADKLLQREGKPTNTAMMSGFLGRLLLYGVCLFIMAQIGLAAVLTCALGFSMVGFVFKLDGFFSMGKGVNNEVGDDVSNADNTDNTDNSGNAENVDSTNSSSNTDNVDGTNSSGNADNIERTGNTGDADNTDNAANKNKVESESSDERGS